MDAPDTLLSPRELRALAVYAATGNRPQAARVLRLTGATFNSYLRDAYRGLGVNSAPAAWKKLGWLKAPPDLLP